MPNIAMISCIEIVYIQILFWVIFKSAVPVHFRHFTKVWSEQNLYYVGYFAWLRWCTNMVVHRVNTEGSCEVKRTILCCAII